MAEMAAAAWAAVKAASAYVVGSMKAVAAGTATAGQVATYVAVTVGGSMAMSAAAQALMKPNVGGRAPGEWVADPNAGIPFAIGPRIGVGGNIVYKNTWGKDNEYKGIVSVVSGAGPITGYLGFTADKEAVTFSGDAATGRYSGQMWMRRTMGNQPDVALSDPSMPGWGANYKLSGKASFLWVLKQDSKFSVYPQGEPSPIHVVSGIKGYDHRFDDTFPGGSGPCRLGVPATYRPITNPIIADLNWCLGLKENGKVVGGLGVSPAGINWAAYTRAANIADANGWVVAALPRSDEPKSEVRAAFLQAGGAVISRQAGLISCVSRGAPKSPVMTISAADTAGPIELDTAANVLNRLNQITPRYLSEAHDWQLVAAAPVTSSVYLTEDRGRLRSDQRDYPYVPNAKQAAELAALDLANTREGIAGRWPLKAFCRDLEPGDVFTVDEPGMLLDGMDFLVLHREFEPATSTVYVTFVSETAGKVDWALGRAPNPPPTPALSARVDLSPPASGDWSVTLPTPVPGNVQVPTATITITIDNARAEGLIVEKGPSSTGPWRQIKEVAINGTTLTVPLYDLAPNEVFWLALSYRAADTGLSVRDVKGPFTAGDLVAGDTTHLKGEPVQNILDRLVGVEAISATNEAAVSDLGDRVDGVIAEAEDILAGANGAADLAVLKAGEANGSAQAANTAAGIATAKSDEAGNHAQAARAERLAAEAAREGSDDALSASVDAVQIATAKAGEAGNFAEASEGAATRAQNAEGNALTYRNQASSAKDDAVSASVSAGTSAVTAKSAVRAAGLVPPFTSQANIRDYWTLWLAGAPDAVGDLPFENISETLEGWSIRIQSNAHYPRLKSAWTPLAGQVVRVTAKAHRIGSGANNLQLIARGLDAAFNSVGSNTTITRPLPATGTVYTVSAEFSMDEWVSLGAASVIFRLSTTDNTDVYISAVSIDDVTAEKAAAAHAATALAQSSNASTSAASAEISAKLAAQVGQVSRRVADGTLFTDVLSGAPETIADLTTGTVVTDPNEGQVREIAIATNIMTKVALEVGTGRTFRVTARTQVTVNGTSNAVYPHFRVLGDGYASITPTGPVRAQAVADGWVTTVHETTSEAIKTAHPAARYLRGAVRVNRTTTSNNHSGATSRVSELWIEDVTAAAAVSAQLAITAAVAADSQTRLSSVAFGVTGGAGGDPFDVSLKAGPDGSDASITATKVRLRNVVNGQVIDALIVEGGKARFGSNVEIAGNLVVAGSIDTAQLKTGAVSKGASAASTASTSVGLNTWTDLLSVAMTTAGGEVSIDFGAQVSVVNSQGPNAVVEVRFMRGSTVLETMQIMDVLGAQTIYVQGSMDPFQTYVQINSVVSTYVHPFTVDTGAPAGSHTWKVQMRSQAGATVGAKKMRLQELKR